MQARAAAGTAACGPQTAPCAQPGWPGMLALRKLKGPKQRRAGSPLLAENLGGSPLNSSNMGAKGSRPVVVRLAGVA